MPSLAMGQLAVVPDGKTPLVFPGSKRPVSALFQNSTDKSVEETLTARVFQSGGSLTLEVTNFPWKLSPILPHQSVLETVPIDFPTVTVPTRFIIRWEGSNGRRVGLTEIGVIPANVLSELKPLLREKGVGIFGVQDDLKSLLKTAGIEFEDLEAPDLKAFRGDLVIARAAAEKEQQRELAREIKALTGRGVSVVLIDDRPEAGLFRGDEITCFWRGRTPLVLSRTRSNSRLAGNAAGHLHLLRLCQLALQRNDPEREPWEQFNPAIQP